MRKILLINSITGIIQIFVGMLLVFFTIPVFLNKLGPELFGVYSILLLIGNLNSLGNFGITSALIKFVAEQGKSQESDYDILTSFITLSIIIIILSIVAFLFRQFVMGSVFAIDQKAINQETIYLYNALIVSNFLMFIGQIGTAVLDALQKIYLTNIFQMIYNFLYWGLILLSLTISANLQLIGISIVISSTIWFILVVISFFKHWGPLNCSGFNNNFFRLLKKNLNYGIQIYASGLLNFLFEPLSKILVGNFIGIKEVGLLDIILRIKNQVWSLFSRFLYPLMPFISQEKDLKKLAVFISDIEQKLTYLFLPIIFIVIFGTHPFIYIWIGKDVDFIANGIILLVIAHLTGLLLFPNYQFLTMKGYPGKTIVLQAINALVNIFFFFIFLPYFDRYAIIISNFMAMNISTIANMYYQKKYLKSFIFNDLKSFNKWGFIFIVLCFTGILIQTFVENRVFQILSLLISLNAISILLFRLLKVFSAKDIQKYLGTNKIFSKFIERLIIIH